MSWTAVIAIAVGAYFFKFVGVAIGSVKSRHRSDHGPEASNHEEGLFDQVGKLIPPAVLFGLIVSQTVATNGELVADARLVGVAVGAFAAWRQAPFWAVLLVSAAAAAAIRSFTGIP